MLIAMSIIQSRIYLASQSPRRRELLKQIGISFELLLLRSDLSRGVDVDEASLTNEPAEAYVKRVCLEKARAGWESLRYRNLPPFPVLAADTSVVLDGKILGKPENIEQAADMLRLLSGREHQVLSAVAIVLGDRAEVALSTSTVRFTQLSDERIKRYLRTNEFTDKTGGYAIQGYAGAFIEHLSGSYSGVMGLPLFETVTLLRQFDFPTL